MLHDTEWVKSRGYRPKYPWDLVRTEMLQETEWMKSRGYRPRYPWDLFIFPHAALYHLSPRGIRTNCSNKGEGTSFYTQEGR